MLSASKRYFIRIAACMLLLLLAYFVSTLLHQEALNNILSPLNALSASGVMYFAFLRSKRTVKASFTLLFYALAIAVWGLADILWAVVSYSGGVSEESPVLMVLYVLTNCILLASLIFFAAQQFRKWDRVQTFIDMAINGLLCGLLIWTLFFNQQASSLVDFMKSDFTSVLSILTDILIDIFLYSLILSVRSVKIPTFMKLIALGLLLFTYSDIAYYYVDFKGLYTDTSLIDFFYIASLVLIAFGGLWKIYRNRTAYELTVVMNSGGRRRWVYLFGYPVLTMLFQLSGLISFRLTVSDFLTWAVSIFLYWAFCKYVQVALEREALLKHSNELLEQRVSEQVSELTFLTNQDTLTTLFNRRYFMECLDSAMENRGEQETIALLIIDMDRFKTINDTFGHDVGDRVLIEFSYRLLEWNTFGAAVARLGGDEFAVMFAGNYAQKDIENYSAQIVELCITPFSAEETSLSLTISIGIAMTSEAACDGKTLMQNADIAMYRAKSQGYNKYQVFDHFMSQDFKKSAEIEVLLRQTDAEKDFELFFQPQYALPGRELIGAEALIRWKDAEHGYIPPNIFIPIAEQIDYIFKIGNWVMQETVRQSIEWNRTLELPLKVGFNISPKQFKDLGFTNLIKDLVAESGVKPDWIDAEITESLMLDEGENIDETFSVLRELGISVSIDDFGSGYSALGYLIKYPFDRIKIDKSLIDNVNARNIGGANIVRAAINMAHASGIRTIAEGVETEEQLNILIELGCDQVQGYLLGRPVPADVFEQRYLCKVRKNVKIC